MAATGTYIDEDDVKDVWGEDNVVAWSDLTGGQTEDEDRIQSAIDWAEKRVENKFRRQSIYQVPFVSGTDGIDAQLTDWLAVMAGDWLYRSRQVRRREVAGTEGLTSAQVKRVMDEMDEVLANQSTLDLGYKSEPMPDAPACV